MTVFNIGYQFTHKGSAGHWSMTRHLCVANAKGDALAAADRCRKHVLKHHPGYEGFRVRYIELLAEADL